MKPIFTGNADINKTSFLNWRTSRYEDIQNILVLAEGFLDSSIELARACLANNDDKKADVLIFPMLTNANHGIELYLKALVWTLNKLIGTPCKIEEKHNIKQILNTVKSKIREFKGQPSLDFFNQETEELQEYIEELFGIIQTTPKQDKMDFSRYPMGENYDNHFYIDEIGNVEIDIENFVVRFEKIKYSLDERASYFFYHELNQE